MGKQIFISYLITAHQPIYKDNQIIYKYRMKKSPAPSKFSSKKTKNRKSNKSGRKDTSHDDDSIIYGLHAVIAALQNPVRKCQKLTVTKNALNEILQQAEIPPNLEVQEASPDQINKKLKPGSVHQGALLNTAPLPEVNLETVTATGKPIIVLDQVTDPRNIGAIIRAATVFGAGGLVMTRHNSPASGGALAKTASGALEKMPLVRVANLARCLESLSEAGYLTCGLDEEGAQWLGDIPRDRPIACVMGAEGKGLRRLTKENCAQLVRLTASDASSFATLNVATATAVALYEIIR